MIGKNIKDMSAVELIEFLRSAERCDIELDRSPFGFDLRFIPLTSYNSSISNMEMIAEWAKLHKHTISVGYDSFKEAIVVRIRKLFPDEMYKDEELL